MSPLFFYPYAIRQLLVVGKIQIYVVDYILNAANLSLSITLKSL